MTRRYVKHPDYKGKPLSLYVSGGDRTIRDGEVLEGAGWDRFVSFGFLVEVEPEPEPVPQAQVPPPAPEAETTTAKEAEPVVEGDAEDASDDEDGGATRSTADKVAKGFGGGRRRSR